VTSHAIQISWKKAVSSKGPAGPGNLKNLSCGENQFEKLLVELAQANVGLSHHSHHTHVADLK
jgi:hypothetical protein